MTILKLTEPGSTLTMEVVSASVVEGDFGKQVKFEDRGGDVLFVPESSVTRQLDRCGVAEVEELSGTAVHFSRSTTMSKAGKPFWNLDKAKSDDVRHQANGKPPVALLPNENGSEPYLQETGAPPKQVAKRVEFHEMLARYDECREAIAGIYGAGGQEISDEAFVAATATLFIQRMQKGV